MQLAGGDVPQAAIDFSPKGWHAAIETDPDRHVLHDAGGCASVARRR
jgi:hypothetical protein